MLKCIRYKRLEWIGHVWRADGDVLNNVLIENINKKRLLGRPRTRWKYTVEKDIRLVDGKATLNCFLNSKKWRRLLAAAKVLGHD